MKYLSALLFTLGMMLCSCNRNDEPPLEVTLPIYESYLPVSVEINVNDIDEEQKRELIHLVNNEHIINDASEIPDDPVGLNDAFGIAFSKINFKENTLLIKYILHDWTIDSYQNRYYRNTQENSYNWAINIGTASGIDPGLIRFTRFAILVKKLPADCVYRSWQGLTSLGWYPE